MSKPMRLLSPREKLLISLLALLVLYTGLYHFFLAGQLTDFLENQQKAAVTEQELVEAKYLLQKQEQQGEATAITSKLNSLLPQFNTQVQSGSTLVGLVWQSYQGGVTIEGIKPLAVVERKHHLEIPFTLKISGLYPDIVQFIKVLENLPNLSEIRRADFQAMSREQLSLGADWQQSGNILAELDIVIFSDKSPGKPFPIGEPSLEQWGVGRDNAFQTVAPLTPVKGMPVLLPEPPVPEPSTEKNLLPSEENRGQFP